MRPTLAAPFRAWWKAEDGHVATDLYVQAQRIELNTAFWKQRCQTLYKLVNGEDPPITFGYWLTRRAAQAIGGLDTLYSRPYVNAVAEGVSFLENRIGTTHSIVEVTPNDTTFKVREACREVTSAVDALFDQHDVYGSQRLTFRDRSTFGLSFVKVVPGLDGKSLDVHRVMPTDILADNTKRGRLTELIQVCYLSEDELMEAFGGVDERTDSAIRNAPRAFVQSPSGLISDQRVLLEAWHLQGPGDKGRHVLCLPNCDLVDETYERSRFPFAMGKAKPQTAGFYVNGPAFDAVPYQLKINDLVKRIDEGQQAAHGYWLVDSGTGLQAKNLGARPRAVIEQKGGRPAQFYVPQAVQPELYEDLRWWVTAALQHGFGISPAQGAGEKPAGVNSGRGLRIAVQIEDSRHKSYLVEMENEAKTIAELIIETAEEINLQVITSGVESRTLRWSDLGIKRNKVSVSVFPISSLPSEPAGKANEIDDRYANGVIDKRTYRRLLAWGDLRADDNYATAEQDLIESTLDEICRTQKFIAPDITENPQLVIQTTKARYALERRFKAPRKTLRALQQYMAVAADMVQHPDGQFLPPAIAQEPAPAAAPPIPGAPRLAPGAPPAPPPVQVSPPMGAPPAVPAAPL